MLSAARRLASADLRHLSAELNGDLPQSGTLQRLICVVGIPGSAGDGRNCTAGHTTCSVADLTDGWASPELLRFCAVQRITREDTRVILALTPSVEGTPQVIRLGCLGRSAGQQNSHGLPMGSEPKVDEVTPAVPGGRRPVE